jgi:hypothetical protein
MRHVHDYKGWRFGLTALEQDGRWTARIEVYRPGTSSREQSPIPLRFGAKASSEKRILFLARQQAEAWIDKEEKRQCGPRSRPGIP